MHDEPNTAGFEEEGASAPSASARHGHKVIAEYVRNLGQGPGVYRMLDAQGAVLYVGKARNLKKRVANYAKPTGHSARIGRMIAATASMMFLSTETETEALLLEQNLIKQLKPRYNVLLRDDKSFPNILIPEEHPYPAIKKHRGMKREKGAYFGPFASAGAVNRTLNQLQKAFLLRNCSDSMFESRTRPDQALLGPVRGPDQRRGIRPRPGGCPALSAGPDDQCAGQAGRSDAGSLGRDGVRAGGGPARPDQGVDAGSVDPGR